MTTRRSVLAASAAALALPLSRPAGTTAAQGFAIETNVLYGTADGEQLFLDVYQPPDRAAPRPAVVVLHPGAWTAGTVDRNEARTRKAAEELAEAGYVAFNADYRLTEFAGAGNAWPSQLDDVQRLVRWVRHNAATYNVDPARIGAYGHSAGAQLAAMLGVRETRDDSVPELGGIPSRVSCVVALAGHFDLTIWYPQQFDRDSVTRLIGWPEESVPDAYRDASPLYWVDAESAPFLIIHGGTDEQNPVDHARLMTEALHDAAREVTYLELPRGDHFSVADWTVAGPWTLTFLGIHLKPDL